MAAVVCLFANSQNDHTWYTAFYYVDCTFEHLGRVNLAGTLPVLEVVVELWSVVSYLDDLVTQEHYVLNVLL